MYVLDMLKKNMNIKNRISFFKEIKNGQTSYFYSFKNREEDYTQYFNAFGRLTKRKGEQLLKSKNSPKDMYNVLTSLQVSLMNIPGLAEAQNIIDVCNSKRGCNRFCHQSQQKECEKLKKHSVLIEKKLVFNELKEVPLEEYIEKNL